ncbi:MAG: sugar phosphate isomerase/epimerase family protein [Candidatus Latescibacteria bacterium]|jgi:sugar phosphate isomerase/epimerase|nr:sugar phosphate isomerase/epimerase family protein [Candidatus Latescibacterota bacterium]
MKYGIRDGMLKAPMETMFSVAKEIGFDGVEFCIGREYQENILWEDGGAEKLKALADAADVEISSLSPGVFSQFHPALPEEEKCAEGVEILTHVIESCAAVDTQHILVPMFPKDMDEWPDETWDQLVDGFKALGGVAEKHGVILDLETTFSADQLVMIVDRVGSKSVKVYHDTGNTMSRGQDPAEEILKLEHDGVGMIHAKDTDRQALGEGRVDFDAVDAAMREIGYDGYIVLETPVGDDPNADNAKNLAFIRKLGV